MSRFCKEAAEQGYCSDLDTFLLIVLTLIALLACSLLFGQSSTQHIDMFYYASDGSKSPMAIYQGEADRLRTELGNLDFNLSLVREQLYAAEESMQRLQTLYEQ